MTRNTVKRVEMLSRCWLVPGEWKLSTADGGAYRETVLPEQLQSGLVLFFRVFAFAGLAPALVVRVEQPATKLEWVEDHPKLDEATRVALRAGQHLFYGNPSTCWKRTSQIAKVLPRVDEFVVEPNAGLVDVILQVSGLKGAAVDVEAWAELA